MIELHSQSIHNIEYVLVFRVKVLHYVHYIYSDVVGIRNSVHKLFHQACSYLSTCDMRGSGKGQMYMRYVALHSSDNMYMCMCLWVRRCVRLIE